MSFKRNILERKMKKKKEMEGRKKENKVEYKDYNLINRVTKDF